MRGGAEMQRTRKEEINAELQQLRATKGMVGGPPREPDDEIMKLQRELIIILQR